MWETRKQTFTRGRGRMSMVKEILIAPLIGIVVLGVWYKLEPKIKEALKKYMEKKADKESCAFIDPTR